MKQQEIVVKLDPEDYERMKRVVARETGYPLESMSPITIGNFLHQYIDTLIYGLGVMDKKPDCEHANHDGAGCLGYSSCWQDDEPIDACKECKEYTGNKYTTEEKERI